ncbi:MAG: alpha-ketoacid dehydrogenase subunit beta [Candidatus Ratteibacteria bacterium]|jgi:pyruvate dehydrogenase E1 component beta subunit
MSRELKFFQAVNEATDQSMARDKAVYTMGLGVPDPKGIFGTTLGLQDKYGSDRVMDMPASENGMTGVVIGSALVGMRPIMTHQRIDFALLSIEQIVNQAAKWHYMFGGKRSVPLVIRMLIGRGWGQGPQHSQSLQAWFAHVPGLKVVMPVTPYDAKGLLISSIEDNNPVIFIEHRWLYNITGPVPEKFYRVPLGKAKVVRKGTDLTIVATSYMVLEAFRAAEILAGSGIHAEIIDIRTLKPLDDSLILDSVRKTGRLIVADTGWKSFGVGAEIIARVAEEALADLKSPPVRVALPDCPTPTSPELSRYYYPRAINIVAVVRQMLGMPKKKIVSGIKDISLDIPGDWFKGPF